MNLSKNLLSAWGVATAVHLVAVAAQAATTIDTFDNPSPAVVFASLGAGPAVLDGPRTGGGILGSRRLRKDGEAFEVGDSLTIGDGALVVVSQPFQDADSTVITFLNYDFTGLPDGSASFAGDVGLELTFTFIESYDFPGLDFLDAIITLETTSGVLQAVGAAFNDLAGGTRTDLVPYASFSGPGSLAQVTSLEIRFNDPFTSRRLDFTLTRLASVPEPATAAIVTPIMASGRRFVRRVGRLPVA